MRNILNSLAILFVVSLVIAGCNTKTEAPNRGGSNGGTSTANGGSSSGGITSAKRVALPEAIQQGKVEFRVGEGEEQFSLQPKDEGASCKLYNEKSEELCKFRFVDGKLKAKTPDDQPLFELKAKDEKLMIKDASGENELFKLKLKGTTLDFYLPGDKRVYRIKKQDYGWRLEDNSDNTLFRAKSKDGKMVLRNLADQTVLYSNDIPGPLGLVFFEMEELSFEQQAALCVFFLDR